MNPAEPDDDFDPDDYEEHWDDPPEPCDACGGTGWVRVDNWASAECPECGGA